MKLVRPPMTNLKMMVSFDSAISTCNPLPLSIKALVPSFSKEQAVSLWRGSQPSPHHKLVSKIK